MGLRINNNIEAFNAHRTLNANSDKLSKSMARLSSGFRINTAADDAAGLGISERMRSQISGLAVAQRNVQDGVSYVQTAEGALNEISSILQRVRELSIQYNGTGGANGNFAITSEIAQLSAEAGRIITSSQYNGIQLINNPANLVLQVGPNGTDTVTVTATNGTTAVGNAMTVPPVVANIDLAITRVANERGRLGAMQNRLEYTSNSLGVFQENLMAAESRIRDVDMAAEMTKMTKLQILQESGMAMLAQANQQGSSVLSLLRG